MAKLLRRLRRGIAGGCSHQAVGGRYEVYFGKFLEQAALGGDWRGGDWRGTFLSQADEGPLYFNRGSANWGLFYFLEVFSFLFVSSGCSARCSHA